MTEYAYFHGGFRGRVGILQLQEAAQEVRLTLGGSTAIRDQLLTPFPLARHLATIRTGRSVVVGLPGSEALTAFRQAMDTLPVVEKVETAVYDTRQARFVSSPGHVVIRVREGRTMTDAARALGVDEAHMERFLDFLDTFVWLAKQHSLGEQCERCEIALRNRWVTDAYPVLHDGGPGSAQAPVEWHLEGPPVPVRRAVAKDHAQGANVTAAWRVSGQGRGRRIAVIDSAGFFTDHADFLSEDGLHRRVVAEIDVTEWPDVKESDLPTSARPGSVKGIEDQHGTMCAGAALGLRAGVAPQASLIAIRDASDVCSLATAFGLWWAAIRADADVVVCPWTAGDQSSDMHELPPHVSWTRDDVLRRGRQGRGTIVIFSAGNTDRRMDLDEYVSDPRVITIGGSNSAGRQMTASRIGHNLVAAFPAGDVGFECVLAPAYSSRGEALQQCTATGEETYKRHLGGTSFAASAVAGVVSLMLAANDTLSPRDVRSLLVKGGREFSGGPLPGTPPSVRIVNAASAVEASLRRRRRAVR